MWKHLLLDIVTLTLTMVLFVSCFNHSEIDGEDNTTCVKLSQNNWRVWTLDDFAVINLMGIMSEADIFDVQEVIGANYATCDALKIKFLTGYDIVSAQKVTRYYPTIWSGTNDDVMQFVYLLNLCHNDTLPLNIHSSMIEYPLKTKGSDSGFQQYFGSITKSQILASIDNIPAEYARKNTSLVYEYHSWEKESRAWKRIASDYKPGELTDEDNEPFDVDPYEILLVVAFKKGDGLFTKIFRDEAIIGN